MAYDKNYPPYVGTPKTAVVKPVVNVPAVAEPVKVANSYEYRPDPVRDAAVQANAVRKNDPPKHGAKVRTFQSLAKDIQDLTSNGPGKVTQVQLDALHAKAQSLLSLSDDSIFWGT